MPAKGIPTHQEQTPTNPKVGCVSPFPSRRKERGLRAEEKIALPVQQGEGRGTQKRATPGNRSKAKRDLSNAGFVSGMG